MNFEIGELKKIRIFFYCAQQVGSLRSNPGQWDNPQNLMDHNFGVHYVRETYSTSLEIKSEEDTFKYWPVQKNLHFLSNPHETL